MAAWGQVVTVYSTRGHCQGPGIPIRARSWPGLTFCLRMGAGLPERVPKHCWASNLSATNNVVGHVRNTPRCHAPLVYRVRQRRLGRC